MNLKVFFYALSEIQEILGQEYQLPLESFNLCHLGNKLLEHYPSVSKTSLEEISSSDLEEESFYGNDSTRYTNGMRESLDQLLAALNKISQSVKKRDTNPTLSPDKEREIADYTLFCMLTLQEELTHCANLPSETLSSLCY